MMFELLLDVMDRFLNLRDTNAECAIVTPINQSGAHLRESYRTRRDGSFGVTLSKALRARLRSHRPSGTFRNRL
jgi:hypothetical protein